MVKQRLQKYLAHCGVSSRRAAEKLIISGYVEVNDEVVTTMGVLVDSDADIVKVAGHVLHEPAQMVYIAVHKPVGVLSTARDERGRTTVLDLLPPMAERVYPVGRLDADSEGLLLLTNDGALAALLMHPRHNVPKTYIVTVAGEPSDEALRSLRQGVMLVEGLTRPADVTVVPTSATAPASQTVLEITLREGRKRQIRRMCAAVGLRVLQLRRVRIGSLELGELPLSAHRHLSAIEVAQLKQIAGSALADPSGS